ncbi:MAG: DUF21 domain-containing protein [Actinomycetia bacterium]|nr:DUF21 domain-containing protein [Actinomycetes bacterium]
MAADVVLVLVLVGLVSALFALALGEASLLHVRRSAAEVEAEAGNRRTGALVRLLDDLPRVMNAVLLTVLLAQVAAATVASVLARRWFGSTAVSVAAALVTVVLFVYGEAIPKTLALRHPLPVATALAGPLQWLSRVLRPVVSVLVVVADVQSPGRGIAMVTAVSEEELRHLADEAAAAGRIEESDAELIERSFDLGDMRVSEVLVPVDEVVAVPSSMPVTEALRAAIAAGHRRLPVYDGGEPAAITGFVRMRDLADAATAQEGSVVADRQRDVLVVPDSERVIDLLRSMQAARTHLAAVVDSGGRIRGIVTIEDVVEELVGTIED